jgi:endonuclease/exonuclease/phosphatase family metal-dependent hydrolase
MKGWKGSLRIGVALAIFAWAGCGGAGSEAKKPDAQDVASVDAEPKDMGTRADLPDAQAEEPPLVVMTYNVLCSFCNKEFDPWEQRLGYFADIIARHDPDLIGLQELFLGEEVEQIAAASPGYAALWWQDDEQVYFKDYADSVILYRVSKFEVVENGYYWLSETPDEPLSGGWADANLPRLVAWAVLRRLSDGLELYFASTHFDNNPPNQEMSAPLFVERTAAFARNMPAIVVGDFNSKPDSPAYAVLTAKHEETGVQLLNTFEEATAWSVDSNQDPLPAYEPAHRIDHIFVAGADWAVPIWTVDTWVYGASQMYPSDHLAMIAVVALGVGPQ